MKLAAPVLPSVRNGLGHGRIVFRRGFTAIELIGVLAVIAIIAAVLVPSVIKRIDEAARMKDAADMDAIAESFLQAVVRTRTITNHTGWARPIAEQMSLSVGAVSNSARGFTRVFLVESNLNIGGAGLPFIQGTNGTAKPVNSRVMIVSSYARPLPISSGIPATADFNAIWTTPDDDKPAGAPWAAWAGKGDELQIRKIDLVSLFHRLVLINHDLTGNSLGKFSIDSRPSPPMPVPFGGLGWDSYYLDGTVVGLHQANDALQTRHLIKSSIGFVYEQGAWHGEIQSGRPINPLAEQFSQLAAQFARSGDTRVPNAKGATPFSALVLMYGFMFNFTLWANECPIRFDSHGTSTPPEYEILDKIGGQSQLLDAVSDTGGLLK